MADMPEETEPIEKSPNTPQDSASPGRTEAAWIKSLKSLIPIVTAGSVVIAAAAVAYSGSLRGPFIFDDYDSIQANQSIRKLWPVNLPFSPPAGYGSTVEGRPILNCSFAVNYAIGERNVFGYHVFNLVIHLLNSLLIFALVRRTMLLPRLAGIFGKSSTWLALFSALLWAVHPLGTQAVSYISQRAESLAAFFCLIVLYAAARGINSSRPAGWFIAAIAANLLGMGCKETMVAAPILVLLYDRLIVCGSFRELFMKRWWLYLGLVAGWAILGGLISQTHGRSGTAGFGCGISPWDYALTQFCVICHYLYLTILPNPLVMDYGTSSARGVWEILPCALIIAAILALTVRAMIRRPAFGFLAAVFFVLLAPTSSFVPLKDFEFEYRMYLPLAALTTLAVCAVWLGWRKIMKDRTGLFSMLAPALAGFLIAACLGAITFVRNFDYCHPSLLWEKTVAVYPSDARAWANWGATLREEYERTEIAGKPNRAILESAMEKCTKAVELDPKLFQGWFNRGLVRRGLGQFGEAIGDFARAMEVRPKFIDSYIQRALTNSITGSDWLAMADMDKIVELEPFNPETYRFRGELYIKLGRFQDAISDLNKALDLDDRSAAAYFSRGQAWRMMNSPQLDMREKSLKDFQTAVDLKPDWAEAWCNLGIAKEDLRLFKDALSDLTKALILKPDLVDAYFERGRVLGHMGYTYQAMEDFTSAIQLNPNYAMAYANRARTYFELGQFDKSWDDVHKVQQLGGQMDFRFLQELMRITGRNN